MLNLDDLDLDIEAHRWPLLADSRTRIVGVLLVHIPSGIAVIESGASNYAENRELAERRLRAVLASARAIEAVAEAVLTRGDEP